MNIIAIDPGFEKVGYALFTKKSARSGDFDYIDSGLIKTSKLLAQNERLHIIHNELSAVVDQYNPQKLIMEQLFFSKNQKTVIGVAQAQGSMMLMAAQRGIPVEFLTPLEIKQIITGNGNADKKSVHKMITLLLKQNIKIADDDQSDAIACGLAYCYVNVNLVR